MILGGVFVGQTAAATQLTTGDVVGAIGLLYATFFAAVTVFLFILGVKSLWVNWGLALVSVGIAIAVAVAGGYGIAGLIAFPIGIVYAFMALGFGSLFGVKGEWAALALTIFSLLLTYIFGGIDVYCSHHSVC